MQEKKSVMKVVIYDRLENYIIFRKEREEMEREREKTNRWRMIVNHEGADRGRVELGQEIRSLNRSRISHSK